MPELGEPIASELRAVLGPTNTGKTHRCIERLLEFDSGMIGLPLRLLAREVYDRVTARVGEERVALVTGEERRIPRRPDYWICTVEAMPKLEVDFVAVDEIQLVAHATRGHVFTDRLLHARGRRETWFLGSDTARPLLAELVPAAKLESYPRLSRLGYAGSHTLARLPERSAVIAFSLPQVYELAEKIRMRKGGAAVVLGALSPRTRNAQVAMYQAGEVDTLVATDAIGMGLNLALTHVAFASLGKYDGRTQRELYPRELGQIAGRAGRYLADGTFGVLSPGPHLDESVARAIEDHRFEPLRVASWRNTELDFGSLEATLDSLGRTPPHPALRLFDQAEDAEAFRRLSELPRVRERCRSHDRVRLLWEVCQIPDYRKLLPEIHAQLLWEIFEQLTDHSKLRDAWLEQRVAPLDDPHGDLDALMGRIAFTRTWIYVSQRDTWVESARVWQERTRAIEDRMSDALHERLVQRFVQRTRRVPMAASSSKQRSHAKPERRTAPEERSFGKLLAASLGADFAPSRAPAASWVDAAVEARHEELLLTGDARVMHETRELGRLVAGKSLLHPEVTLTDPELTAGEQARLRRRLNAFARDVVAALREPWYEETELGAAGRGLLYQLFQNLGALERRTAEPQLASLTDAEWERLSANGVRSGRRFVWVPALLRRDALRIRHALVKAFHGPALPETSDGAVSLPRGGALHVESLLLGYVSAGPRYVRCDIAERVLEATERDPSVLCGHLGCRKRELDRVLVALGAEHQMRAE